MKLTRKNLAVARLPILYPSYSVLRFRLYFMMKSFGERATTWTVDQRNAVPSMFASIKDRYEPQQVHSWRARLR